MMLLAVIHPNKDNVATCPPSFVQRAETVCLHKWLACDGVMQTPGDEFGCPQCKLRRTEYSISYLPLLLPYRYKPGSKDAAHLHRQRARRLPFLVSIVGAVLVFLPFQRGQEWPGEARKTDVLWHRQRQLQ